MLRRLVHFGFFVLVPAVLAAVSIQLQPIRDWVLEPTYIRWAFEKDERERTLTFAVHNSGPNAVDVCISYRAIPRMAISDFFAGFFGKDGPDNSFAGTLAHLDVPILREPSMRRLIDPHLQVPSLVALESELRKEAQSRVDRRLPEIHARWLQVCDHKECSKEEAFEVWEQPINLLRASAISNWYSATGWQVFFTQGYLSPAADLNFVRQVQPHGTSYLRIQFSADKVDPGPLVQSPGQPGTEVLSSDIQASDLAIAWNYRRWPSVFLVALIVLIAAIPILKPKPLEEKPTYELVNQALLLDGRDQETADRIWDLVYARTHKDIGSEFEAERTFMGNPPVRVTTVRLFEYVRTCLRIDFGKNDQKYRSKQDLDSYVSSCLQVFANI
jgi:hypothetical protein